MELLEHGLWRRIKTMDYESSNFSFEIAYEKLEKILAELSSGKPSLERSLELYETAHKLIISCSSRLNQAEEKIEMLIKNRKGALETVPYNPESDKILDSANDTNS